MRLNGLMATAALNAALFSVIRCERGVPTRPGINTLKRIAANSKGPLAIAVYAAVDPSLR